MERERDVAIGGRMHTENKRSKTTRERTIESSVPSNDGVGLVVRKFSPL